MSLPLRTLGNGGRRSLSSSICSPSMVTPPPLPFPSLPSLSRLSRSARGFWVRTPASTNADDGGVRLYLANTYGRGRLSSFPSSNSSNWDSSYLRIQKFKPIFQTREPAPIIQSKGFLKKIFHTT